MISDELNHSTVSVYAFQCKLISHLKEILPSVKKIFYFSDGCAEQYKNRKNFINLAHHFGDFGIEAQWHFFATSHGKGPYDGIGGTIKREAAYYSLKQPYSGMILTAKDLYFWANDNLPNIQVFFLDKPKIHEYSVLLHDRFENSKTIPGTPFIPILGNQKYIKVKRISSMKKYIIKKL